jgi:hypothetical protein
VVLAGDLLDLASAVDLDVQEVVIQKYLRRFSAQKIILSSSGNHDIHETQAEGERIAAWLEELHSPMLKPDGESFDRDGVVFTVCPWWDGPATKEKAEAQIKADALKPKKMWIWLHHNPPAQTPVAWTGKKDGGDSVIVDWIGQYQPDYVFSGHIHNAPFYAEGSWRTRLGKTWVFNPGKQIGGEPTRIILDLAAGRAEWHSLEGVDALDLSTSG